MNPKWGETILCQDCKKTFSLSSSLQRNKSLNHKLPEIFDVIDVNPEQLVNKEDKWKYGAILLFLLIYIAPLTAVAIQ